MEAETTEPIDTSDSRVNLWNFCPRAWAFHYIDGWRRNVQAVALSKGKLFHAGVEFAIKTVYDTSDALTYDKDTFIEKFSDLAPEIEGHVANMVAEAQESIEKERGTALSVEELEEFAETLEIVRFMVSHYLEYSLAPFLPSRIPIAVEYVFEDVFHVAGLHPVRNVGVIDLLLLDPFENCVYVVDHKSAKDLMDSISRLEFSQQTAGYVRHVQAQINEGFMWKTPWGGEVAVKSDAVTRPIYRIVRNKKPNEPKELKDGGVSAAAVSTIRPVYERALLNQGFPPTEKQLARFEALPDNWVASCEPVLNSEDLERWENDMSVHAVRMDQARRLPMYRTKNTSNCVFCDKKIICTTGDDPEFHQLVQEEEKEENDATTR